MAVGPFLPLLAALAVATIAVLSAVDERARAPITRTALALFGDRATGTSYQPARARRLRASLRPTTYRTYAAETALYSLLAALAGGVIGIYVVWGVLRLLAIDPETARAALPEQLSVLATVAGIEAVGVWEFVALLAASGLTFGLLVGGATYGLRWWYPAYVAGERGRKIEAAMPQTVAFVYALSRSGMAFPQVMEVLADHRPIYGEAAVEFDIAVRHMELFGQDAAGALEAAGDRTPSEAFGEFAENLASVLRSGRSISSFLRNQYEDFQEEAEAQQRQLLDLLSTLAEAYVTVFVAGPLFLITILVVLGVTTGNTLSALQLVAYFVVPLGNLAFVVYLDSITDQFGGSGTIERTAGAPSMPSGIRRAADGGRAPGTGTDDGRDSRTATDGGADGRPRSDASTGNLERLYVYRRLEVVRAVLGRPLATVVERPTALLAVTVPIAVLVTGYRLIAAPELSAGVLDDLLVQAALFVLGTFAIAHEVHRRRIDAIEAAVPDLLDRLASINEAGMSLVESLERVRSGELGALDREVDRIWADVRWGATIEGALARFERRVGTRPVSRVVALLTNAMDASGNISEVLRIAAEQAKADRRLKRRRRQEMLSYLVVVYIAFAVFLVIVVVLTQVLIPTVPEASSLPDLASQPGVPGPGGVTDLGGVETAPYTLVLFHALLVQAVVSGTVAGQMSTGDVRGGAKHATILLAVAYLAFLAL